MKSLTKNGVPYEEFDKWFRKTHQSVGRVVCVRNLSLDTSLDTFRIFAQ